MNLLIAVLLLHKICLSSDCSVSYAYTEYDNSSTTAVVCTFGRRNRYHGFEAGPNSTIGVILRKGASFFRIAQASGKPRLLIDVSSWISLGKQDRVLWNVSENGRVLVVEGKDGSIYAFSVRDRKLLKHLSVAYLKTVARVSAISPRPFDCGIVLTPNGSHVAFSLPSTRQEIGSGIHFAKTFQVRLSDLFATSIGDGAPRAYLLNDRLVTELFDPAQSENGVTVEARLYSSSGKLLGKLSGFVAICFGSKNVFAIRKSDATSNRFVRIVKEFSAFESCNQTLLTDLRRNSRGIYAW